MAILNTNILTGCDSIPDFIPSGTSMLFRQTTSPTSWTKSITHNNKTLRVVSGTASFGGNTAFTSVLTTRTVAGSISGTVSNTTVSTAQMPTHNHNLVIQFDQSGDSGFPKPSPGGNRYPTQSVNWVQNNGSSSAHSHGFSASFSGNSFDFDVQYVDIIISTKN